MNFEFITSDGIKIIDISCVRNTGVAKGFCTTRQGGISVGPSASMNCNVYKKFDLEAGKENFRLFCSAIGVDPSRVITNRLTAGTNIVRTVSESDLIDIYDEPSAPRADGLITNDSSITLFLYSADCATIQLVDPVNKAIGALHAGWVGSLNGIIPNTVNAMREEFGSKPEDIICAICPSIAKCCFEVGEEVANCFIDAGFSEYVLNDYSKPHIDLYGVNRKNLENCGIKNENIHSIELCTYCNEDLFHSYRRGPIDENGAHLNGMNGMFIRLN